MPFKLNLSVPLMWDILQFNCATDTPGAKRVSLFDASLAPKVVADEDRSEDSMLEIVVATSPEITVDTTDGGQEAPGLSRRTRLGHLATGETPRQIWNDASLDFIDNLTFNTTPWLYADPSQFATLGDIGWIESQPAASDTRVAPWWEGGNFSNAMFN